ncbi:MAG: flagellar hook-associated protein FlgK [Synergistaceae bacterium]|nr:flagellar hook-associated protein FlgK [Synergistaceae bacterium]
MSSTFGGIELGKTALNAFRLGMQTVGHNIANMGTEGYSRQRVNYATNTPMDLPGIGQVGQGVHINDIERIRDEFLDFQFRDTQTALGYWEKVSELYDSIQNYISEPNSSGIRDAMNTFFTDLQTLQQSPEDTSTRRSLVESARSLGDMIATLTDNFQTYNKSVNTEIETEVADINRMLYDIAALNKEIASAEALDQNANDLRDSRDLILDKLSKKIDITYNEPLEGSDGVPGEFFVTLNGRAIVQGTHVRELKAHAFIWDNQVYYDVQVSENEFDIVSNPSVADILATGPEGNYLLSVDRIANGVEWTTGGGDAHCLEVRGAVSSYFAGGVILDSDSNDIPYKLSFRVLDDSNTPSILTVKIDKADGGGWNLRAEINGEPETQTTTDSEGNTIEVPVDPVNVDELTTDNLAAFINSKAGEHNINLSVTVNEDDNGNKNLTFKAGTINENSPVEITDYSGMLGTLTEIKAELTQVNMRSRVNSIDEALNISGSFRIQVGTQGTRVTSKIFTKNPSENLELGEILSAGEAGEKHTFRIGVSDDQVDITASWNASTSSWTLSSDIGNSVTYDDTINVEEFAKFLSDTVARSASSGDNSEFSKLRVTAGPQTGTKTQFYIESSNNHLISISDVTGNLAERMNMANDNPVITINVESSDSLATIRNKINEKYQAELGITQPEQWVHASVHQDSDQSWYLTIAADVAGEAQRITLMGAEDGNMQVLRRLGLTKNEEITVDVNGTEETSYREVTYIPPTGIAQDAAFSFNGVRYLSSDNMFKEARRIPNVSTDGSSNYSASVLSEVSEGMWFNLKNAGITSITVKHHVRGGSVKGLEEVRDGLLPNVKDALNEVAFNLAKNFNAYQYSGYGIANEINTTGTAFFKPLAMKSGAAKSLAVSDEVQANISLIGAAMGLKDENGIASSGKSGGSGDGTNASRMVNLNWDKIVDGTTTLSGVYDAMLTEIGAEAAHANLMYKTQQTVSDQIDSQRQAVSGVNLDEELVDIVILNRAFGAMARYVTAIDEMLNTIINGFGLVGR